MKWREEGFVVGVVVVVVVFVVIFYRADHHRTRVNGGWPPGEYPVQVLFAKQLIPKDTRGSLIASGRQPMFGVDMFPAKEVEDGVISDPRYLIGRASVVDIVPGQQLMETEFTANASCNYDLPGCEQLQRSASGG